MHETPVLNCNGISSTRWQRVWCSPGRWAFLFCTRNFDASTNLYQKFDASFSCEFLVRVSRRSFSCVCHQHKANSQNISRIGPTKFLSSSTILHAEVCVCMCRECVCVFLSRTWMTEVCLEFVCVCLSRTWMIWCWDGWACADVWCLFLVCLSVSWWQPAHPSACQGTQHLEHRYQATVGLKCSQMGSPSHLHTQTHRQIQRHRQTDIHGQRASETKTYR